MAKKEQNSSGVMNRQSRRSQSNGVLGRKTIADTTLKSSDTRRQQIKITGEVGTAVSTRDKRSDNICETPPSNREKRAHNKNSTKDNSSTGSNARKAGRKVVTPTMSSVSDNSGGTKNYPRGRTMSRQKEVLHEEDDDFSRNSSDYSDDGSDEPPSGESASYEYINVDEGRFSSDSSQDGLNVGYDDRECMLLQRKIYNEDKGVSFSVDIANAIKRVLKEKIYPKVKLLSDTENQFLAPDFVGEALDQSRRICDVLIRELDLPSHLDYKVRFWITYRSLVKNQLVKFRSNCVEELKKQYFRVKEILHAEGNDKKNEEYLKGCNELLKTLEEAGNSADCEIVSLRENSKKEAFFFFAREFLPSVVKRLVFRQNKLVDLLSDFVTVSDEAFTLLLLENNVARWNAMYAEGKNKSDDNMPPQKFQIIDRNGGKDGYSLKAARRYNEYYKYVDGARKTVNRETLESELMQRMEALDNGRNSRGKKNKRKRDGELNYVDEEGSPLRILDDL